MEDYFYSICKEFKNKTYIKPIKKLSQNFLLDCDSIKLFFDQVKKFRNQDILEIGTGIGSITIPMSIIAKRIITIEIDRRLSYIKNLLPSNVELIFGDGLEFVSSTNKIPILVSNMPYNITSDLLVNLAKNNNIRYSVLGMQKEVAERINAIAGKENYGRLSVIMQIFFNIKVVGYIQANKFFPKPSVDSSVVVLERKNEWRDDFEIFEKFTSCIFSQKNKKADKVLKHCNNFIENYVTRPYLSNKRIRDLTPNEILDLLNINLK